MTEPGPQAWPSGAEDAIGQAAEFLVWASLIAQSGGSLHVFLPMLDRGIDALIHRLDDGAYLAVQVKAKIERYRARCTFRNESDTIPAADSLADNGGDDAIKTGSRPARPPAWNVLAEDYWDLYTLMLR